MRDGRFGIEIIGCGVIAPYHARAVQENADLAELVAVSDVKAEARKALAEKFEVPAGYEDYHDLIEDSNVDVVCVCTPTGMHGEMVEAAARAGKHVLCEKPLEVTVEKCDRAIEACRTAGVKLGNIFQRRILPKAQMARRYINEGRLGKMVMGNAYLKYYRSPDYYKSADWRATWELDGGGAFMNQGVHGIDLLLYLMGDVKTLFAKTATLCRDIEVEDIGVVAIEFANGALGTIEAATCVNPAQGTTLALQGELGSISFDDSGIKLWNISADPNIQAVDFNPPNMEEPQVSGGSQVMGAGHVFLLRDMLKAIRDDRDPFVTPESARRVVEFVLAVYKSAATGKEITLI